MKIEERIKLNLNSLCVYKGIFQEKFGDKFVDVVDKIYNGCSYNEIIKAYNEFAYELFKKNKSLSFKECIINEMLLCNNPFNKLIEEEECIPTYIVEGVKEELEALGQIACITSKDLKATMLNRFEEVDGVNRKIEGLLDWGNKDYNYKTKNNLQFEEMKSILFNSTSWSKCIEELISFHKSNGTGRAVAFYAFVWERFDNEDEGHLREILEPDPVKLTDLIGYESQKEEIKKNTESFLNGIQSNNLLLYGSRGTGKSSTVKAILNEYYEQGLRLIEVDKKQLSDFTRIIRLLKNKMQKYIIFVDDLVFEENEDSYSALKTILEGRIESRPNNILIYATTNRRHLVQEKFSDRDEVNYKDTMEEKLSLADRFGVTISFFTPDQKQYLSIVEGLVKDRGIIIDDIEELHKEALQWEKWHNGRSPRSATQFVNWLQGEKL